MNMAIMWLPNMIKWHTGILQTSYWTDLAVVLLTMHITLMCVTLYLHRCQAHRAITMHTWLGHVCRFWLWLTTGMSTKEWVSVHRKHHAHCESSQDPHSPQQFGIQKVLWEGAELYKEAAKDRAMVDRYSHGVPNDWIDRHLYEAHSMLGIGLFFVACVLFFGVPGVIMWSAQMMCIPFFAAGVVNGVGHYVGYRNFESQDASRNFLPIGVIIGGEEFHNNHHAFGTSAKFSIKWWEFDIGWLYICVLRCLGLVKVKRTAPLLKGGTNMSKSNINVDSVAKFVTYRMSLLARYAQHVTRPVLRSERSGWFRFKCYRVLARHENLLKGKERLHLHHLLHSYPKTRLVYQFHQKLNALWDRTTATHKELLDALHAWCAEAERTNIAALVRFTQVIRGL
jgi:stearoyl-CoA desaturase (Delta-9 desaturase)